MVPRDSVRPGRTVLHATTVCIDDRALLIVGPSGSGKSALALRLMALGATLVADDRTEIGAAGDGPPLASAPRSIEGLIEARGVGLLRVASRRDVPLVAVADMASPSAERLPHPMHHEVAGCRLPCFERVEAPRFADALIQILRGAEVQR